MKRTLDIALFKSHKMYFFISPLGGDDSISRQKVHHKTGTEDQHPPKIPQNRAKDNAQ